MLFWDFVSDEAHRKLLGLSENLLRRRNEVLRAGRALFGPHAQIIVGYKNEAEKRRAA